MQKPVRIDLRANQRTDLLAGYDLADISPLVEVEDNDRQIIVFAK